MSGCDLAAMIGTAQALVAPGKGILAADEREHAHDGQGGPDHIAQATIRGTAAGCSGGRPLDRFFLSWGQSDVQATENLDALITGTRPEPAEPQLPVPPCPDRPPAPLSLGR